MMNYNVRDANRLKLVQPADWAQSDPVGGYNLHEVVETPTNLVIKSAMTQSEAKAFCRHLNMGGGFDGFTPGFFLEKIDFTYQPPVYN